MHKGRAIGDILAQLLARRGFARVHARDIPGRLAGAAGLFSRYTRPGALRGGRLEVTVANSTLVRNSPFGSRRLAQTLAELLPDEKSGPRFRVGPVG